MHNTNEDLTVLLNEMTRGDSAAASQAWSLVYHEIHKIAHRCLAREPNRPILETTMLVNEAYLKLVGQNRTSWNSRRHFYRIAAQAIRRILIDLAREANTVKRGGGTATQVSIETNHPSTVPEVLFDDLLDLDDALTRLARINARLVEIVELRFFAGLSTREVAEMIDVSTRTVEGDWQYARAWLHSALSDRTT